jgi:hypothetical protein
MYSNLSPALAAGTTGLLTGEAFASPLWGVLAGFAILAACTALARIVPRPGTLPKA